MKRVLLESTLPEIYDICLCDKKYRNNIASYIITAGISSKDITSDMIRVKSSNMWAYKMNIKDNRSQNGDMYIQFKGKNGGPGDVYVYFNVPIKVYRRGVSAPSKGHWFWQYVRNNFQYAKLTGDKKGKLPNAVR